MTRTGAPEGTLVFVHIPKTAGLTVRGVLDTRFAAGEVSPFEDNVGLLAAAPTPDALARYRLLRGHFWFNIRDRIAGPSTMLTFLRDPVERTLSQYAYVAREPSTRLHDIVRTMTLEEYLWKDPVVVDSVRNVQSRFLAALAQPTEQVEFLSTRHGGVALALENLEASAVVGVAEAFERSMQVMAWTFQWRPIRGVFARNVATARQSRASLPPHVLERILELNSEDVEIYAHGQALLEQRHAAMVAQLLEDADAERRQRRAAPPVRAVRLDLPIDGDGWYAPEQDATGAIVRWMGPDTSACIDLRLPAGVGFRLRVELAHWVSIDIRDSLRIHIDGRPLHMTLADRRPYTIRALVPSDLTRGGQVVRLSFDVSETRRPIDLGLNQDERRLGVAFSRIQFEPVPGG